MFNIEFLHNKYFPKTRQLMPASGFRYFEMGKNNIYKIEETDYVHFLYLLEGEISLKEPEGLPLTVKKDQFMVVPDSRIAIRSGKDSKFILFSINEYYCRIEPGFSSQFRHIMAGLRKQPVPLPAPKVLKAFFHEIIMIWKDKLYLPNVQDIKKKELFIILEVLFSAKKKYEQPQGNWQFGAMSLS